MNVSVSHKAVCRTAQATPGLLKNRLNATFKTSLACLAKIEKLEFDLVFMKGLNQKKMFTVLFWVPKNPQNGWKYFAHLDQIMDYNEVWFSRSTFHEKPRKNLQGVLFSRYR